MTAHPFGTLGDVNRAGDVLRRASAEELPAPSAEEVREAREVATAYRAAHAAPLRAARMGLRSCIITLGLEPNISRRLKRMPTMEDKLKRESGMKLSRMQDIGGCRAVLPTQDDVSRVSERFMANSFRRNGHPDAVRDYVVQPQKSGYRAVHIYTKYQQRRIEVQLRTPLQDQWAKAVEDLTSRTGIDYKSGEGPEEIHDLLRNLSEVQAAQEARRVHSQPSPTQFGRLIEDVVKALEEAVDTISERITAAVPYLGDQRPKNQEG